MPVNITVELVQQLMEQNAALIKQNEELTATVSEFNQTIKELKEQLSTNSKNSSKPPSSDRLKRPAVKKIGVFANPLEKNRELRKDMMVFICQ